MGIFPKHHPVHNSNTTPIEGQIIVAVSGDNKSSKLNSIHRSVAHTTYGIVFFQRNSLNCRWAVRREQARPRVAMQSSPTTQTKGVNRPGLQLRFSIAILQSELLDVLESVKRRFPKWHLNVPCAHSQTHVLLPTFRGWYAKYQVQKYSLNSYSVSKKLIPVWPGYCLITFVFVILHHKSDFYPRLYKSGASHHDRVNPIGSDIVFVFIET